MKLDTHQHFWQYDPAKHGWIDEDMNAIARDFMPADLKPLLDNQGIEGCIVVQVDQTEQETLFLLSLSEKHDFVRGVVGWVDLRATDIDERLSYWSQFSRLKGFRHIVQGEADHNFLLRPDFLRGIERLKNYHFTYDILVFPHQLGAVLEFVRRFPDQLFVIDHLAKPYIKDGFYDGWKVLMQEIANSPNVYCKVSGMVTEANWSGWVFEDFVPYLDVVFEAFGPDRLMFGSDWPVCLVAADYDRMYHIVDRYLASHSEEVQAKIMGLNGARFYRVS